MRLVNEVISSSGTGNRVEDTAPARRNEGWLSDLMVRYQQGDAAAVETLVTNSFRLRYSASVGEAGCRAAMPKTCCRIACCAIPPGPPHLPVYRASLAMDLRGRSPHSPGCLSPPAAPGIAGSAGRRKSGAGEGCSDAGGRCHGSGEPAAGRPAGSDRDVESGRDESRRSRPLPPPRPEQSSTGGTGVTRHSAVCWRQEVQFEEENPWPSYT